MAELPTNEVRLRGILVGHVKLTDLPTEKPGTVRLSLGFEMRQDLTEAEMVQALGLETPEQETERLKKVFFDRANRGPGQT